ncbi:GNAT family N-acetyltransferase [Falsibacillus pallidus]|uniref:GNAT family N-acetyltransferase n=1 Tax=Falsibacillus pallidus TaxID=493781 RepID=UPI003D985675
MLFVNGRLGVRLLERKDAELLAKWLSDPAVLEFYEGRDNSFDMDKVIEKFYPEEDEETRCIIEYDDAAIGYIQFYEADVESRQLYGYEDDAQVIYGMDQFIGETSYWNKGIGTLLVQSMVKYLIEEKQADRVVMDPQTWNERAIRCYEKCGFKKVKLLPKNEWHEGEYRDCWLIEKANICS